MASLLEFPGAREVATESLTWPARARAALVTDAASYIGAADLVKGIKALRQKIAETFDPHIAAANKAHKDLIAEKARHEAPLTEAERIIKTALVAYDQEQQRLQREAQRQAEADARARAEREALDRAAALEAEGAAFGDAGMVADAHALLEEAIQAPTPAVPFIPKETPKVAGVTMRTTWSCACVDLAALIRYVAAHPEHTNLLVINPTACRALANAQRERMNIPGLRAVPTQGVAAGR